jgi:hypothetical protein
MLQSGLSIVGSLADALTRGIHVPGLDGAGPVEREGGVQWVVDSARVQLRPQ